MNIQTELWKFSLQVFYRTLAVMQRRIQKPLVDNYFCKTLHLNPSSFNPGRREKVKLNFYFHTSLWCLKRFWGFETPQKSVKINIQLNFYFNTTFRNPRDGKGELFDRVLNTTLESHTNFRGKHLRRHSFVEQQVY